VINILAAEIDLIDSNFLSALIFGALYQDKAQER